MLRPSAGIALSNGAGTAGSMDESMHSSRSMSSSSPTRAVHATALSVAAFAASSRRLSSFPRAVELLAHLDHGIKVGGAMLKPASSTAGKVSCLAPEPVDQSASPGGEEGSRRKWAGPCDHEGLLVR